MRAPTGPRCVTLAEPVQWGRRPLADRKASEKHALQPTSENLSSGVDTADPLYEARWREVTSLWRQVPDVPST